MESSDEEGEIFPRVTDYHLIDHENKPVENRSLYIAQVDMAQEDDQETNRRLVDLNESTGELRVSAISKKPKLSWKKKEHIRFMNVKRNKDFICQERVGEKLVNILQGLELHTGVFSAAEQKRIVDNVYQLQEMGKRGELKERTYTAPQKWMRGKGRVTIQCWGQV